VHLAVVDVLFWMAVVLPDHRERYASHEKALKHHKHRNHSGKSIFLQIILTNNE